jgi:hypothetical protein
MKNNNGFIPEDRALDIVLTLIKGAFHERVDFNLYKETPAFKAETLRHLAVIHNRLLANSSLDGLPIDAD